MILLMHKYFFQGLHFHDKITTSICKTLLCGLVFAQTDYPSQTRLRFGVNRSGAKLEKTSLSTNGLQESAYGYVSLRKSWNPN